MKLIKIIKNYLLTKLSTSLISYFNNFKNIAT